MTADNLREFLTRRPFELFVITMSSGNTFEVPHPEMALIAKTRMMVVVPDADGKPSDRVEYLSYLHIAHVQTLEPAA